MLRNAVWVGCQIFLKSVTERDERFNIISITRRVGVELPGGKVIHNT